MRLSELVQIKLDLIRIQQDVIENLFNNVTISSAQNYIESLSGRDFTNRNNLMDFFSNIKKEQHNFVSNLEFLVRAVEQQIEQQAAVMYDVDFSINGQIACAKTSPELERLNCINQADPELKNIIAGIIALKTNPRFPCLEIGPGDGQWTEHLVAADPLYIVDIHEEFLQSTVKKFDLSYQRRIRPYLINEAETRYHLLEKLPQEQFGFVFAWDVFTFFPPNYLEKYLSSVYQILKPGGCILFNYNNCENYYNSKYAEIGFKSWMPTYLLEKIAKKLNYNIENFNSRENVYWAILRKPGSLRTVKSLQGLGEIVEF